MSNKKRLGDLLVEAGKISGDQLNKILKKQRISGKKLGELVIEDGILTEEEIIEFLKNQLNIERARLDSIRIDRKAVDSLPEFLARRYNLIPIEIKGGKLRVAMVDPLNLFAIDDIKLSSGLDVEPMIAGRTEINSAIDKIYTNVFAEKMANRLRDEVNTKKLEKVDEILEDNMDDVKNAPIVKLVDSIINNAIKLGVSDVHIEPFEDYVRIRNRVDGILQEYLKIPKESSSAVITRIKIMSGLDIAEKRIPQDGRVEVNIGRTSIDLRVSVLPTVHGEKIVIRLLNKENYSIDKSTLGLSEGDIEILDKMIRKPFGIILVTGPTGSGKSTTLYSILKELNKPETNVITVEDPVEYVMEGICQVNVNIKAGLTFASGLRSILRQDPDVVMVGEIRDNETAEIAIRAAITGHLVLSTIHTNDSPSAVVRLADMGVQPYLLSSSIAGIISQRLIRRVCSKCAKAYTATDAEKRILQVPSHEEVVLYKGDGCPYCNQKGYKGRVAIYEIMSITKEHRELMQSDIDAEKLREINGRLGYKTLFDSCIEKVLSGVSTVEELMRVVYMKE